MCIYLSLTTYKLYNSSIASKSFSLSHSPSLSLSLPPPSLPPSLSPSLSPVNVSLFTLFLYQSLQTILHSLSVPQVFLVLTTKILHVLTRAGEISIQTESLIITHLREGEREREGSREGRREGKKEGGKEGRKEGRKEGGIEGEREERLLCVNKQ